MKPVQQQWHTVMFRRLTWSFALHSKPLRGLLYDWYDKPSKLKTSSGKKLRLSIS